jgi:HK97 family phage prohead protease
VKLLWQHYQSEPLGKILELREDARGLFIKAVISDTARGRDALALLRDEAINGFSIGYDPIPGGVDFSKAADGRALRNLREVRLWEASLVTMPMNEAAGVTALKEVAPPDAPLPPDADALAQMYSTIASLQTRLTALEAQLAPAEKAGRADEPSPDQAGPLPTAPTSTLETALQELALLLKIS